MGIIRKRLKITFSGYNEIQNPRKRKRIIDFDRLMELLNFESYDDLKDAHYKWVAREIQADNRDKEDKWTQSIAVGSKTFVEKIKAFLGFRAIGRKVTGADDMFELREGQAPYGKADDSACGNTFFWN